VILISNIVLEVLDGSTVPSTDIYGADKKAYINIGSGNVFNLKWTTTLTGADTVNYYTLVIKRFDPTLNVYYDIFDKNIGLVNKFYVNSDILPIAPEQYLLHIYVVAYGKAGSVITSNVVSPYVCKGSGTYVKVQPENYSQSVMKRAVTFVNATQTAVAAATNEQIEAVLLDSNNTALITSDDKTLAAIIPKDIVIIKNSSSEEVSILDKSGNPVQLLVTKLLASANWQLASESSVKGTDGTWHTTNIKYEALVVKNEVTGKFEPLEVRSDTTGNYEQLYTL
jgi:hypothetical protein